jgi:hypothetical protein
VRAREFARFVAFAKRGRPVPAFQVPSGRDPKEYEKAFQRAELERSLKFCRDVLGCATFGTAGVRGGTGGGEVRMSIAVVLEMQPAHPGRHVALGVKYV